MLGALIGLTATVVAALLALAGVLRTGRAPAHLADIEGLARLADELRTDLNRRTAELTDAQRRLGACQRQLGECWGRVRDLEGGPHA